jgi:hypothetical protein
MDARPFVFFFSCDFVEGCGAGHGLSALVRTDTRAELRSGTGVEFVATRKNM